MYEENFFGEDCRGISPIWPSDERPIYDDHDVDITRPPWSGADHVTLERCTNCQQKLGIGNRLSTVPLTPGPNFNPAWTMEAMPESGSDNSSNSTEYLTPKAIKKNLEGCQCTNKPPQRPPKPLYMDKKSIQGCNCNDNNYSTNPKVGPYENYDVPKPTHAEVNRP